MNNTQQWYASLVKPEWAPPSWIFGPVWSVLYIVIAISYGMVFYKFFTGKISGWVVLPFALNLIFNVAFSPIQFGLKNNYLASLDILLVLGTLIWALIMIWPQMRWVSYVNLPYLLWVLFATGLQLTITFINK
jgi:tryptophan-rich sensory protein